VSLTVVYITSGIVPASVDPVLGLYGADSTYIPIPSWYQLTHRTRVYAAQPHRSGTGPKRKSGVCASLQPVRVYRMITWRPRDDATVAPTRLGRVSADDDDDEDDDNE